MELGSNNREAVKNFLDFAGRAGWNWVAFDPGETDLQGSVIFHGFRSAAEAVELCTAIHDLNAFIQGEDPGRIYRYLPVETLGLALQNNPAHRLEREQLESLFSKLSAHGIQLPDPFGRHELENQLSAGAVFPVTWQKTIDPATEVDRFIVLEHHHAGHQIYEIGHSVRVLDSFSSLADAERLFHEQLKQEIIMGQANDYLIAGCYRGQAMESGQDGWPEEYSGLVLRTAFYQYYTELRAKTYQVQEPNTLSEAKNIRHHLYARYDHTTGAIRLYDDLLKETKPENIRQSTWPSNFIHEKLTIKCAFVMNEKNYDYLKNQVKFLGFGDSLEKDLGEKIKLQPAAFSLEHQTKFGEDQVSSVLNFQKSRESEMYFFNSFDMTVKSAGKEDEIRQTYYVGKENNLTLKERYNMLEGRAVFKEFNKLEQVGEGEAARFKATDETYQAWAQLNFKQTDENGNFLQRKLFGFDLEKTLAKYPIRELEDNYDKNRLVASLEKGNKQTATITVDGAEQKVAIEANPLDKGLKFYDSNMQRLEVKQNESQRQQQGQHVALGETGAVQKEGKKESQQQGAAAENKPDNGQRKRNRQKIS